VAGGSPPRWLVAALALVVPGLTLVGAPALAAAGSVTPAAAVPASAATTVSVTPASTPAVPGGGPDPDVVFFKGAYYGFTTGTALGNNLQVLVDTTGNPQRGWRSYTGHPYGSSALPHPPSWETPNTQTSPGVAEVGSHWVMWYDVAEHGHAEASGYSCLSVATATSLTLAHPVFTDHSTKPAWCPSGGVLDPAPFVDPATGVPYLIWKSNDGSSHAASHVYSVRLDPSGTRFDGTPVSILVNDTARFPWETTLDDPSFYEGPHGLVLTFSVGNWQDSTYAMAFATCSGPKGPCHEPAGAPFLRSYGTAAGPGGGMLFAGKGGSTWLVYAAWKKGCTASCAGAVRRMFVAHASVS